MMRVLNSSLIVICLLIFPANVLALMVQTNFSGYTKKTGCLNCENYFENINIGDKFKGSIYYEYEEVPEFYIGQGIYENPQLKLNYEIQFDSIVLSGSYFFIQTDGVSTFLVQDERPRMVPEITDPSISLDEVVMRFYGDESPAFPPFFPTSLNGFTHGDLAFWAFRPDGGWGFEFNGIIDNVQSTSPVPEPATAIMLAMGLGGLLYRKKIFNKKGCIRA